MGAKGDQPPGERVRRRLYELAEDADRGAVAIQRRLLSLGREYFGVESAHLQRRRPDEPVDEVVVSVGDDGEGLPAGATLDRSSTYCRRTVERTGPLALSDAPGQGWADDPAYREHGFDCYLGATVFHDGDAYGTVCFVSRSARGEPFTAEERALADLVARLVERTLAPASNRSATGREVGADDGSREALLQVGPDAVLLVDDGEVVAANDAAADLVGHDAVADRSVLDLVPEAHRDRVRRLFGGDTGGAWRDRFDDGTPLAVERADGSTVPVAVSVNRVDAGDRELLQVLLRDISERRERERERERDEEFLRQIQRTAAIGGWGVDFESETLRWTEGVYRIHDLPLDYEPTVEEGVEFYHPEDRPAIREAMERLVETGEPYDLELRLVTADGEVRWVNTIGRPVHGDDGETVVGARGVFRDITERKERERELRIRSRAIEEAPVGITIADATRPEVPLVYANTGFERLTGYGREEARGRNCRFLQGEGTDEATRAEIREAIAAEESVRTRVLNYRASGTPFWNQLTVAPVTAPGSDEVTHFVGIQQDTTALQRRERLIEVLDRVLRHNIRNDMNVVQGYAREIAERGGEQAGERAGDVAALAEQIVETAGELTELTEKARTFELSVLESDPAEPRDAVADVRSVVERLRSEYPETTFRVEAPDRAEVIGTGRLRVALEELGENAARHGDDPVTYEVETTGAGRVAIRVRDRGSGLPELERSVLEAGRETTLEHGTGLGLWMVNWVVTELGGDLTVTVDGGTTVTIRFASEATDPADGRRGGHRDAALGPRLE